MDDWKKIKREYIRGGISYKKLAEKYGVSLSSVNRRAAKEKWADLRKESEKKSSRKIVESVAEQQARRVNKVQNAADLVLDKLIDDIQKGVLLIDSKDYRSVMACLKDFRDVNNIKSELDMQEQMARIEKLRKESRIEENQSNEIRVVIADELRDYAE